MNKRTDEQTKNGRTNERSNFVVASGRLGKRNQAMDLLGPGVWELAFPFPYASPLKPKTPGHLWIIDLPRPLTPSPPYLPHPLHGGIPPLPATFSFFLSYNHIVIPSNHHTIISSYHNSRTKIVSLLWIQINEKSEFVSSPRHVEIRNSRETKRFLAASLRATLKNS